VQKERQISEECPRLILQQKRPEAKKNETKTFGRSNRDLADIEEIQRTLIFYLEFVPHHN
jgi:hypothetical protein